MNASTDQLGPVDYLVVEFPADRADFSGEMASELKRLVDGGQIRILDLLLVEKGADGSIDAAELKDADDSDIGLLRELEADLAILLAEEDIEKLDRRWSPVAERRSWSGSIPGRGRLFGRGRAGGSLAANGPIPAQAILAAAEEPKTTRWKELE